MPLRGQSAVVIWSDMADPAAHDLWHSREHLPERVAIPGFLRARRCVTLVADAPRYFVLYELKDAAIVTSPAYLARLNQPTPGPPRRWNRFARSAAHFAGAGLRRLMAMEWVRT